MLRLEERCRCSLRRPISGGDNRVQLEVMRPGREKYGSRRQVKVVVRKGEEAASES